MNLYNITVRKFRTEDAKAAARILKENMLKINEEVPVGLVQAIEERFTAKYILSLSNKSRLYVAANSGTIVGVAALDFDTITSIFVDAKHHGEGIEKALISLLEEVAANNGIQHIKLITVPTAQRLYESQEYTFVETLISEVFGACVMLEKFLV